MQVFLTVFSGVLVFVISQIFLKLVIDPVHQLKRVISDISFALIQYAHVWNLGTLPAGENKELLETSDEFRRLGSQLNASCDLIPLYRYTRKLFFLPREKKLSSAISNLAALSDVIFRSINGDVEDIVAKRRGYEQNIRSALNLQKY